MFRGCGRRACLLALLAATLGAGGRAADPRAPDSFVVDFVTDVPGTISVNVTRSLAPLGADRVHALVQDGFFDQAAFFRVVPGFVVQFGIAGTPAENRKWDSRAIQDDPVVQSNTKGSVVFATAGPDTRTTQLFINYEDNSRLDKMGFAPFGNVLADGLSVASKIFNPTPGDSGGVDQDDYTKMGNEWIRKQYPKINSIVNATIRN
jgi:peptidyl-prolyl cis-trans isomerase A (cyclophilin A)